MFAIEVAELQPGDVIETKQCETILGLSPHDSKYPMFLVGLAKFVEAELWRIGKQFTVAISGSEIRVLTHIEAKKHNEATYESGKRKMRLAHRRALAIDTSTFSEDMRKEHFDNLAKQGRVLSSMRKRPEVTLEATVKSTPKRS